MRLAGPGLLVAALVAIAPAAAQSPPAAPVIRYVPGSTVQLEQLTGEEDKERHRPTRSRPGTPTSSSS